MNLRLAAALSLLPWRARAHILAILQAADGLDACPADTLLGELSRPFGLSAADIDRALSEAETHLATAARRNIQAIGFDDPGYPPWLASIAGAPALLWIKGRVASLAPPGVAVVGSRAATPYARDVAARLGTDLARAGVIVVSGLARGVDGAAHRGALDGGGPTVAVFGSGADVVYPAEHERLAAAIVDGGGSLVSELPPGTPPRAGHFPLRNRIISGLVRAVVVVEASEKSGSLITARYGLDQGREVMAVPGNALTGRNRGAHALIRDGAKIVETAADILEDLGPAAASQDHATSSPVGADPGPASDRACREPLLQVMAAGESYELDELSRLVREDAAALLARLLGLELAGLVVRDGSRFVRGAKTW